MTKKIWKIWALQGALVFTFMGLGLGNVQAKALTGVVNLNTATQAQLILLPGIGKVKARVIMEKRQAKPFANFQDLEVLPGLGKKRLAALKPHVVFTGPTTAKNIRQASGELNSLGRATFESARLGTEFSAVLAGNVMTQSMFSDGAHGPEQNLIYSSLMTVAHMRAASHLVDRLLPSSTTAALMGQRSRLLKNGAEDLLIQGRVSIDSPLRPPPFCGNEWGPFQWCYLFLSYGFLGPKISTGAKRPSGGGHEPARPTTTLPTFSPNPRPGY